MALTSELPVYVDTFNFVLELLKDDKQLPREFLMLHLTCFLMCKMLTEIQIQRNGNTIKSSF